MPAKVLIIDDDGDFRTSVKSLLERHGYEVLEAGSGKDGLRMVTQCRPDVIFLDVMMESDAEGYGVTYSLKHKEEYAEFREVPVFMISSIAESPDERFAMSPEAEMIRPDRYLTKPLDIPQTIRLLESVLARKAASAN